VTEGKVLDLLEDCKEEMGVRTPLTLVETPSVSSPSLLGFIRPRLLLPPGLTQSFSAVELRYVFLHELAHLKRSDIALNWLISFVLVLH
jgi:beta-lactamase regulating signal transducer with metallopeptidase domain